MIKKGLELAGKNPTRSGVIHALRNLKSYNGGGLLPENIDYARTIFGHDVTPGCLWYGNGREEGFRADIRHDGVRHGPARDVDRQLVVGTDTGVEGVSDLLAPSPAATSRKCGESGAGASRRRRSRSWDRSAPPP